jgi:RimJ/RimL family protein N-acetyltransferase
MFADNLLGDTTKLRKPVIQDSIHWDVGGDLSTGREATFTPTTECITKYNELQNDPQAIYWSIENKENKAYIGIISVQANSITNSEINLLLFNQNCKGREISIEVITTILNYLKHKQKITKVIMIIEIKNTVMKKVLESIGFVNTYLKNNQAVYQTIL